MSRERIRTGEADDMEEKSDSLTSFVGRDESFKFGYYSGCSVAITGIGISTEQQAIVASAQFRNASRFQVLELDTWLDGWTHGYSDFITPIVIVICTVQEG